MSNFSMFFNKIDYYGEKIQANCKYKQKYIKNFKNSFIKNESKWLI